MTFLIGILSVVFLVLAIMIVSKSLSLSKTDMDDNDELDTPANKWNAYGIMVFLILSTIGGVWSFMHYKQYFIHPAASDIGVRTDELFWTVMIIITLSFYITFVFLCYFAFKYRYKKGRIATFYPVNHTLEYVWTLIPAVVMAILVFGGYKEWKAITYNPPVEGKDDVVVIEVTGKQFNWIFRYAGVDNQMLGKYNYKLIDDNNQVGVDFRDENSFDDFTSSELHLPKGKKVLLQIRARDVLHSVYLPQMRVKMDAVPGMPTKFWFVPTKTTEEMRYLLKDPEFNFKLNCTEICGGGHFSMAAPVIVQSEAEYSKWVAEQKSLLSTYPQYLKAVPASLKAKAMKYIPAATDSSAVAMGN